MVYDAANVLRGEVKEIINPTVPGEAEKVQISIQTGEEPNQEIRIANFDQCTGRTRRSEKGCGPSRRHPTQAESYSLIL
jgi:hypothetical protein